MRRKNSAVFAALLFAAHAYAAQPLNFDELYGEVGVLGLSFSDKVKALAGKEVFIDGFMAPPLKAKAGFFVLTRQPAALCPFCSTDADWSFDIVVVYLQKPQTFAQNNAIVRAEGILEYGSWTDEESGFVSQLRLRKARFWTP
ncbi:MAG: hypothetical protein LBC09_01890 [Helicobacteraceae bacterium]|jgi:hypothetical protein|nr:hypothetical protein [Helicobacteraceae bacterium]